MKLHRIFLVVVLILLIVVSTSTFATAQIIDGPIAREQLTRNVRKMFYQEKYDELEKMARELRKTNATFPEGGPKLNFFYGAFESPLDNTSEGWKRFLANSTSGEDSSGIRYSENCGRYRHGLLMVGRREEAVIQIRSEKEGGNCWLNAWTRLCHC